MIAGIPTWFSNFAFVLFCYITNHLITGPLGNSKHLMTGHKGNSVFCFPETLNVPRGEAEGNIEVEGKLNSLFPEGPVIKSFVVPPNSKIEKAPKKIICLRPLHTLAALAKLSGCQNQPVLSKNFSSQLTKNIDITKVALASSYA